MFPENRKAAFLSEQLELLLKKPKARRYSNNILAMACMWEHVSHTLYVQIQEDDVLTLPSDKYVHRLSTALKVDLDFSDTTLVYLKLRKATLQPKDLNVNLILDEV